MATRTKIGKGGRFLLNLTALFVVLPLMLFVSQSVLHGLTGGQWPGHITPTAGAFLALLAGAAALILWRGWITVALAFLLLGTFGLALWSDARHADPQAGRELWLHVGSRSPIVGTDLYCNGVHLGKTPLTISREEFDRRVKPWKTPPRQDRTDGLGVGSRVPGLSWAQWTWVPQDVFGPYEVWPPARPHPATSNEEVNKVFEAGRYWWRFENDGHKGLARISNFGGGAGGSNGRLDIEASPHVDYPAVPLEADLLIDALRRDAYQPSPEWTAHVRKHLGLLFLELHGRAQKDPRLMAALVDVARAEFAMPETPTPQDCGRVLDEVLARVESRGALTLPSPETMAMDAMGAAASDAVVARFRHSVDLPSSSSGSSSNEGWEVLSRSGPGVRMLPLEYLVKRLRPPALFDDLVYEYATSGRYFVLMADYDSDASGRILADYLRSFERRRARPFDVDRVIRELADVRAPGSESWMQTFVRDHAAGTMSRHLVRDFVESRIGASGIDQGELVTWVYHWAPLDERDKLPLIARIDSPSTYNYIRTLRADSDPMQRERVLEALSRHPNPGADQFVIDSYEWYRSPEGSRYGAPYLLDVLARADGPVLRAFIADKLAAEDQETDRLLRGLGRVRGSLPDWLTEPLGRLQRAGLRRLAVPLLARIGTADATALLASWEGLPDASATADLSVAARDALNDLHAREEKSRRQYADLLAGRIQPDDLLPPAQAWVWNGQEYVPEAQ